MAGGRAGFPTVAPYLMVKDASALVQFIEQAFGGKETFRTRGSAGGLHIEVQIGDSMVMVGGASQGPAVPAALHLYVDDADAVYQRALAAGATPLMEPADFADGDRRGGVADRWGNQWFMATHTGANLE